MKIAVLDSFLVTRDDLSFNALEELGELRCFDFTPHDARLEHIGDAQAIFVNRTVVDRAVLDGCPALRFIGVTGTGYNMVDLRAAAERGITVCNVPSYSTCAVAQMTFALLLEIAHRTSLLNSYIHAGNWRSPLDETVAFTPSIELCGKTMGIVGVGAIGGQVARLALAFGMRVLGHRRHPGLAEGAPSIRWTDFDTLLEKSDVVTLHCPLNEQTRGILSREAIGRMKPGAILLNTARGPLVDESAAAQALDSGRLYAVGTDVLSKEPPSPDNPLAFHPRCVVTPHAAWAPRETRARLIEICVENLRRFLEGEPQNVVR